MEQRMHRAAISSVCVMACVLVVCYRGDIAGAISARAQESVRESADAVVAESTAAVSSDSALKTDRDAMLKSITAFRAYAELAYPLAEHYQETHKGGDTAIVNLVVDFAKDGLQALAAAKSASTLDKARKSKAMDGMNAQTKALSVATTKALLDGPDRQVNEVQAMKDTAGCDKGDGETWCDAVSKCVTVDETCPDAQRKFNVVVDFAKALAKARSKFPVGVNKYILGNLHEAIMQGKKVIQHYSYDKYATQCVGLNHEVLGLVDRPQYFKDLCAPVAKYNLRLDEVRMASTHADVDAAAAWLMQGGEAEYTSFMDKEHAKKAAKLQQFDDDKIAAALKKIKEQFAEQASEEVEGDQAKEDHLFTSLHPLPDAGKEGAKTISPPEVRSEAEIVEAAREKEQAWMAKKKEKEPEMAEVDDVLEGKEAHKPAKTQF